MNAKELIAKYGLTQREVAERMGVTLGSFNNTIRRGTMTPRTLHRMATAIGCDISEFDGYESSVDETPLYPEGTIDLGYVTMNGKRYRQIFVPTED